MSLGEAGYSHQAVPLRPPVISRSASLQNAQAVSFLCLSYRSITDLFIIVAPSVGRPHGWWASGCLLPTHAMSTHPCHEGSASLGLCQYVPTTGLFSQESLD